MFTINDEIRKQLKKPFGKVYPELDEKLLKNKKIFAVGDVCVLKAIKKNIPVFCNIYDYKSKRIEFPEYRLLPKPDYTCRNKAGTISNDLIEKLRICIKNGGNLLVRGEEDLASLYLFSRLNKGIVIYGQPDQGIVITECNEKTKKKAMSILHSLENEIYKNKEEK